MKMSRRSFRSELKISERAFGEQATAVPTSTTLPKHVPRVTHGGGLPFSFFSFLNVRNVRHCVTDSGRTLWLQSFFGDAPENGLRHRASLRHQASAYLSNMQASRHKLRRSTEGSRPLGGIT